MAKHTDPNYDTLEEKAMDRDVPQFIKRPSLVDRVGPVGARIDMSRMERAVVDGPPAEYIPPKSREPFDPAKLPDLATKVIQSFGQIPTGELDEMVRAAEAEIAAIKNDAQNIRDEYQHRTDALVAAIKRLTSGCALARDTLGQLRDQVTALDEPQAAKPDEQAPPAALQ